MVDWLNRVLCRKSPLWNMLHQKCSNHSVIKCSFWLREAFSEKISDFIVRTFLQVHKVSLKIENITKPIISIFLTACNLCGYLCTYDEQRWICFFTILIHENLVHLLLTKYNGNIRKFILTIHFKTEIHILDNHTYY